MKTLYLIRHGKSDWSISGQLDFDRKLNERGEKSAKKIGKFFRENKISPDIILSSPAVRTTLTAQTIAQKIGYSRDIIYEPLIYETHMAGFDGALSCIMDMANTADTVFFVGHNYAITELAEYLCDASIGNIPTCGVVAIEFDIDNWKDIAIEKGKKLFFLKVKEL